MPKASKKDARVANSDDRFSAYEKSTDQLRRWIVGFSVGLPAVIISCKAAGFQIDLAKSAEAVLLLEIAVGVQVLVLFLNKWINWFQSSANFEMRKGKVTKYMDRITLELSHCWGIDVIGELLSLVLIFKALHHGLRAIY